MKLALTVFAADFVARRLDEDATDRRIIGPLLLVTGFACVLILAQPDMGTAMVLGCHHAWRCCSSPACGSVRS